jgi:hypothetical protein
LGLVEDECHFNTLCFLKSKLRKQIDNPLGLGVPNIVLVQFIALETKKCEKPHGMKFAKLADVMQIMLKVAIPCMHVLLLFYSIFKLLNYDDYTNFHILVNVATFAKFISTCKYR